MKKVTIFWKMKCWKINTYDYCKYGIFCTKKLKMMSMTYANVIITNSKLSKEYYANNIIM